MMIIPAKFKLAAIVSVAVISVSAGAVGSSQQQAKPGIILSDSELTPIVGVVGAVSRGCRMNLGNGHITTKFRSHSRASA